MILRRFNILIIVRVILLALTSLAFTWSWTNLNNLFTFFTIGLIFLIQIILLINYINKINRDLNRFFVSLKTGDLTTSTISNFRKSDKKGLHTILNEISESIENVKIEKEYHYQYLKYIVEHVNVGLVAFEENGKIDLMNNALKKMLGIPDVRNIKSFNNIHRDFMNNLEEIRSGQQRLMVVQVHQNMLHLIIRATEFKLRDKAIKLISIQDIQAELDDKELQSWQKLIRILTHEIMNSISPIASLATTLSRIFKQRDRIVNISDLHENQIEDAASGLEIINNRSKGLLRFIQQYRKVNFLPKPEVEQIKISELFFQIKKLCQEETENKNIEVKSEIRPEILDLNADKKMIEQVLINLVNNSIYALGKTKDAKIKLNAFRNSDQQVVIQVIDNGVGIQKDIKESIFVPFYTTRENGSGIGLSLVKQIMNLHKGKVIVFSKPGKETVFSLVFNKAK